MAGRYEVVRLQTRSTPTGVHGEPLHFQMQELVSRQETNGFRLHSFQMSCIVNSRGEGIETIIAVFERQENAYEATTRTDVGNRTFIKGFRPAAKPEVSPDPPGPGQILS